MGTGDLGDFRTIRRSDQNPLASSALNDHDKPMDRRSFLRTSFGLAGTATVTGCLGLFETRSALAPPLVENRPDAVYYPTHKEGMKMVGTKRVKDYSVALMFSYQHRFWLVNDDQVNKVPIKSVGGVHLMGSVWDRKTKTVLPVGSPILTITSQGEYDERRPLWPMISQQMGYHFGDNFELSGDGTYTVKLEFSPVGIRRTGGFRDKFTEPASATFEFEFSHQELNEIMFELLPEKKGKLGALDPMQMMHMPITQLQPPSELPGRGLGTVTSGDAVFGVTALDEPPESSEIDASGPYLAVSPRTPYNRYPLSFMSLSATLKHAGTTVFDGSLVETIDPELGHHYGTTVDRLRSGDTLRLTVDTPPQVSRHEGYETAFLDMPQKKLTVQ